VTLHQAFILAQTGRAAEIAALSRALIQVWDGDSIVPRVVSLLLKIEQIAGEAGQIPREMVALATGGLARILREAHSGKPLKPLCFV
jgi:hypothetical protein